MTAVIPSATRLDLADSTFEINEYFLAQGWTDGLQVISPTEEKVAEMAAESSLPPDTVLGVMAPAKRYGDHRETRNEFSHGRLPTGMLTDCGDRYAGSAADGV